MMRAIRFATILDFEIELNTLKEISNFAKRINEISLERVNSEFVKIITSCNVSRGIKLLYETGILKEIIPELDLCFETEHNNYHHFNTVIGEHPFRCIKLY